jgi:site-specific DNA recombinase
MTEMSQSAVNRREIEEALTHFDPLWQQLSPREQENLVRALVERVSYDGRSGNVTVGFRSAGIKQMCQQAKEGLS